MHFLFRQRCLVILVFLSADHTQGVYTLGIFFAALCFDNRFAVDSVSGALCDTCVRVQLKIRRCYDSYQWYFTKQLTKSLHNYLQ